MATPLQQAGTRRKLIYFGLILVLFTFSTFGWRGSSLVAKEARDLPSWTIAARASDLELKEEDYGQAELTGSVVRLTLTGSRGLAVCSLWIAATEKQKKHQWHEVELLVRSVTRLQPHFITPWLFQSWNLTYNVSVETERLNDMYFYIGRGIELAAEGDRINRNNPDLRYWIGFYYQNKFGVSDKVDTLRAFFQMSCIPLSERDAGYLMKIDPTDPTGRRRVVNMENYEKFVIAHPQLIRRLRERRGRKTPQEIVEFLVENRKVPCRFTSPELDIGLFGATKEELRPPEQQFPILPLKVESSPEEAKWDQLLDDSFDAFLAARAWFAYSLEPLPPPTGVPGPSPRDYDRKKYRLPRQPISIIFRQGAPRAQSYLAERLQSEGWFDKSGWTVDRNWFNKTLVVGTERDWSLEAWTKAHQKWLDHGRANGLHLTALELANYQKRAEQYRTANPEHAGLVFDPPADPSLHASWEAHNILVYYEQNMRLTNFEHFLYGSEVEMEPETIEARKLFFQAKKLSTIDPDEAVRKYVAGFEKWKTRLERYEKFRDDDSVQDDSYERQDEFLDLARTNPLSADTMKLLREKGLAARHPDQQMALTVVGQAAAVAGAGGVAAWETAGAVRLGYKDSSERRTDAGGMAPVVLIHGPLDGEVAPGKPWIKPDVAMRAISRKPPPAAGAPTTPR